MTTSYGERLTTAIADRGRLCVGIDPHPAVLRRWRLPEDVSGLERCARGMVEALGETIAIFKPQSAFFEAYGSPRRRRPGADPGRHQGRRCAVAARRQARATSARPWTRTRPRT